MIPFSNPAISESINRLTYNWADMDLIITADRIADAGNAELWFYHNNGSGRQLLNISKVNLLSTTTMAGVAKRMLSHSGDIPWQQVLTYIASTTIEYSRRGEPGVTLKPVSAEQNKPTYLVHPLIMEGVPNVIFGDKGVNKTTLGLLSIGLLSCGWDTSPSGLTGSAEIKGGILDWEGTKELTNYTLARLVEGGTFPYCEPEYLHCKIRLTDDIDRIGNWVVDHNIKFLLIDSLGAAAGSDKFDSAGKAAALSFFEALRSLNVTSLIIAQNSKSEEGKKTIFGSTYYTYYARNVFELRKGKDTASQDDLHIALIHTEGNYSKRFAPIGFCITYTDTSILVQHEEVTLAELKDRIEDTQAICEFLRIERKMCSADIIAEAIGKPKATTLVVLSGLKKKGKVVNPSRGFWGLASYDS